MPVLLSVLLPLLAPARMPRVDADGIPLPAEAVCRLGSARFRAAGELTHLAVTPDGRTLVALEAIGTGCLCGWDAATGRLLYRVPLQSSQGTRLALAVDRDGARVEDLTHEYRFRVTRFDPATGRQLGRPVVMGPRVNQWAALSPCGRYVAIYLQDVVRRYGVDETDHVLTLHPAAGGRPPVTVSRGPTSLVAAFAPDGGRLAVADYDRETASPAHPPAVRLYHPGTGKLVREYAAPGPVAEVVFRPDGAELAAVVFARGNYRVSACDLATGTWRELATDPRETFKNLAYSPDGRWVTVMLDSRREVLDARTGRRLAGLEEASCGAAFHPDGKTLFVAGPGVLVYRIDLTTGRTAADLPSVVQVLRYTRDGRVYGMTIAPAREVSAQLVGWDVRDRRLVVRGHVFPPAESFTFIYDVSPDGRWVAVGDSSAGQSALRVCDAATGAVRVSCQGLTTGVEGAKFSDDGARLYSWVQPDSRKEPDRRAWDLATGRPVDDPAAAVAGSTLSPDGRMSARFDPEGVTSSAGCVPLVLVERVSGKVRHAFLGHIGGNAGLAFSPDGRHLAASSTEVPVFVWDVRGELSKPPAPPTPAALAVAWDALASGDAAAGFRAVRLLAHFPDAAVPLLRGKLPPTAGPAPAEVAALVVALDAPGFADRETAEHRLKGLGELAGPALRDALKTSPSAELKQRADRLLARLDAGKPGPDHLRAVRAVEAAEWMGTPAARDLLARWAGGADGAVLTREARAALGRAAAGGPPPTTVPGRPPAAR